MKEKIILIFNIVILTGCLCFFFLFYGPIEEVRILWITSAMNTKNHRYLATMLYDNKTIQDILFTNRTIEVSEISDLNLISMKTSSNFYSKWDKEIVEHDKDALYKVISVNGNGYHGKLVAIYDASKVRLAVSKHLGEKGEFITDVVKKERAVVAMNASGFLDYDWNGNGAIAHGSIIQNGKIISQYSSANTGGGIVGFTKEHKLFLGKITAEEAVDLGIVDAVEFGPFLLVNGKSSIFLGNGGFGRAPRSAIGQRKDGIVLFLVINGRIPTSVGATMNDLAEIMKRYGAFNAANMDGGSSSELLVENRFINRPVGGGKDGLRAMPSFWIVVEK